MWIGSSIGALHYSFFYYVLGACLGLVNLSPENLSDFTIHNVVHVSIRISYC